MKTLKSNKIIYIM